MSYNAADQLLTMNYPAANEVRGYNVLNQLTSLSTGSSENLTYNYPSGSNNGKISSMYNAVTASGSGWGQQYGFDSFGNLLSKTVTSGSGPSMSVSLNPATNQIEAVDGYTYDANGNMSLASAGLTYDVENHVSIANAAGSNITYAYDSQNRRVWSWPGTQDSMGNTTGYTLNMYTPTGQKLGAYKFNPAVNGSHEPFMIVALVSSDQFFGSRRLAVMDQLGSVGTYYPWGENRGGTNPQDTWSFGTYWTDSVTGLDYANNRYYFSSLARFTTPDPYASNSGGAGDPSDPQSWNRYSYTRGDPVNRVDPAGMQDCAADFCVTGYGLGDSEFCGSPGVGGSGGIIEPWNDPAGQKTVFPVQTETFGGSAPKSARNVQHFATNPWAGIASALTGTNCGSWLQSAFNGSGYSKAFPSLDAFLTSYTGLWYVTGTATFVGGTASAVTTNAFASEFLVFVNTAGPYFNPLPQGYIIGPTIRYLQQISQVIGGTSEAQVFILLHELAHILGLFQPDANSDNAQAANNDLLWSHCGSVIQGFSK